MFKKRYSAPGTAPATLRAFDPGEATPPLINLIEYDGDYLREQNAISLDQLPDPHLEDGRVRWIQMNGLGDVEVLRALGEKYSLHPLALEDVLHIGQRPKMEPYEGHLFIITQMIFEKTGKEEEEEEEARRPHPEQVCLFLCPHLLITIQQSADTGVFAPVRERIRGGRGFIRKLKADYLAYALLDALIDHCFPALEELGEGLEALEDTLLASPTQDCVRRLHEHRRTLMIYRRFVWPERDVISALLHDESGLISQQTKIFLRDCYDHTVQIMDLIESYRDVTAGLLELYLSCVSLRTNEIMRVLTVISAIFIPLTFVAGVYGMNFDYSEGAMPGNMPELHQPWGYPACLSLMAFIAAGQLYFFRRKKWL